MADDIGDKTSKADAGDYDKWGPQSPLERSITAKIKKKRTRYTEESPNDHEGIKYLLMIKIMCC